MIINTPSRGPSDDSHRRHVARPALTLLLSQNTTICTPSIPIVVCLASPPKLVIFRKNRFLSIMKIVADVHPAHHPQLPLNSSTTFSSSIISATTYISAPNCTSPAASIHTLCNFKLGNFCFSKSRLTNTSKNNTPWRKA